MAHVDIKVDLYRRCKTKAKAWLTNQNGWDRATVGAQQWTKMPMCECEVQDLTFCKSRKF